MAHWNGRGAAEKWLEHGIERAETAQHRSSEPVRGGAIARLDVGRELAERALQRNPAIENRRDERKSAVAGGIGHVPG